MASPSPRKQRPRRASSNLILKEGFLFKKGGIIKSWSRRYFILTHQSLCYFKREFETQEGLEPLGRVFLSDIVTIQTDGIEKRKAFVFALHTKKRAVLLQAANSEDRDKWAAAIQRALETDKEAERKDPFRQTLRRLAPGLKRVTLVKDPNKGIGCTIKNAAGHILVNRIIEDGPIAHTGVLRPGDEILDLHGTTVTGLEVRQVVEVIHAAPDKFLATVRPITALRKGYKEDTGKIIYSEIVPMATAGSPTKGGVPEKKFAISNGASAHPTPRAASPNIPPSDSEFLGSLEDVGNYDDEDEGDIPPPLPPRTEDALILVDPPPLTPPPLPPKPKDEEELLQLTQQYRAASTGKADGKKMVKSHSQGDIVEEDGLALVMAPHGSKSGYQRPPRVHYYEEIKPKLVYADLDMLSRERSNKPMASSADSSPVRTTK